MDFELDADQQQVCEAVAALLEQYAGPARAIELAAKSEVDAALVAALEGSGFLDAALGDGTGALEAALVVEAVSRAGGIASVGAEALVAPGVASRRLDGPIALATAGQSAPVRFATSG